MGVSIYYTGTVDSKRAESAIEDVTDYARQLGFRVVHSGTIPHPLVQVFPHEFAEKHLFRPGIAVYDGEVEYEPDEWQVKYWARRGYKPKDFAYARWNTQGAIIDTGDSTEPVMFLLVPYSKEYERWLRDYLSVPASDLKNYKPGRMLLMASTKTQFGKNPVDTHIKIVELLDFIKQNYMPDLRVVDDGDYWETRNRKMLEENLKTTGAFIGQISGLMKKAGLKTATALKIKGKEPIVTGDVRPAKVPLTRRRPVRVRSHLRRWRR